MESDDQDCSEKNDEGVVEEKKKQRLKDMMISSEDSASPMKLPKVRSTYRMSRCISTLLHHYLYLKF